MKKIMKLNMKTLAASTTALANAGAGNLMAEEKDHEGHDH